MNQKINALLSNLRRDERGLTTVEYVIVLCLIAAMAVGTWKQFGSDINGYLTRASTKVGNNVNAALP